MGFNFVEKFKDLESAAHASSTFQILFQKKKLSENLVNLGMGI